MMLRFMIKVAVLCLSVGHVYCLKGFDFLLSTTGTSAPRALLLDPDGTPLRDVFTEAFSICYWAKLKSRESNIIDLFSLSSEYTGHYNEILFEANYRYSATYLTIGGKARSFSFVPPLKNWTHICLTWRSDTGEANFFIDGKVDGIFFNFQTGYQIGSYAYFYIGQDQDSYNGGFEPAEGTEGRVTQVHMWRRAISPFEVKQAMLCEAEGDFVRWSDSNWGLYDMKVAISNAPCGSNCTQQTNG